MRGFTILELLVVIAIIGVLASVVLASLNASRENARDSTRKAQIEEIIQAFNLYYSENGTYNTNAGAGNTGQGFFSKSDYPGSNGSIAAVLDTAGFLSAEITDPLVDDPDATQPPPANTDEHVPYFVIATTVGIASGICVLAELENPSAADQATFNDAPLNSSQAASFAGWGINYAQCLGE